MWNLINYYWTTCLLYRVGLTTWRGQLGFGTDLLDDTPRHDIGRLLARLVRSYILLLDLQTFACNVTFLLVLIIIDRCIKQVLLVSMLGIVINGLGSLILGVLVVTLIHL